MKGRGFTLVELLIVIGIMGLVLSLVGPLTVNQLDSAKRSQEREQLNLYLRHYQFRALQHREKLILSFEGRYLRIYQDVPDAVRVQAQVDAESDRDRFGRPEAAEIPETFLLREYEFEHLAFRPQQLRINAHGYWSPTHLEWLEGEREMEKTLVNRGVIASVE